MAASIGMTVTTFAMVRADDPTLIAVAVFAAGLAMAPMFPTTLGICGNLFTKMTATAMGIVITSGWVGLTLSSYVIGFAADRTSLGSALLLLPVMAVALIGINLALRPHVEGFPLRGPGLTPILGFDSAITPAPLRERHPLEWRHADEAAVDRAARPAQHSKPSA